MGQKVHPTGIRLGITKDHNSVWYAGKDKYADNLLADIAVRSLIEKRLEKASVSKVGLISCELATTASCSLS